MAMSTCRRTRALELLTAPLVACLQRQGWADSLALQAAFDDLDEALNLVASWRGLEAGLTTEVVEQWAEELMAWQRAADWPDVRKRLRTSDWSARALPETPTSEGPAPAATWLGKCCVARRWSSRLSGKELGDEDPASSRTNREVAELKRYTEKFVEYFMGTRLPGVLAALESSQPERMLSLCCGAKRARTLRARWRAWSKIVLWLTCCYGEEEIFPSSVARMVDYLLDVVSHSRARSLPGQVAATLSFVESAGGVQDNDKISKQGIWLAAVANVAKQLQVGNTPAGNTQVKKAPPPSRCLLLCLELVVCDEELCHFDRMLAFCRLLKVWACLRFDDLQALRVRSLRINSSCLTGMLSSTKVSGPGRKHWDLPIVILRTASLSGRDWFAAGM